MALYHKWDVNNDFTYVLQFFSLISDSLGSVAGHLNDALKLIRTNLEYKVSLIKVCIESSLQPLIQLHVILGRLLEKSLIDENANLNWAQTMEAFVTKDLLTIFNISQAFNPQVNTLLL